jgi:type IV pilus assembly protein PilY1
MNKPTHQFVALSVSLGLLLSPWAAVPTDAGTTTATTQPRPQIVIALGNSESMDGDLGGAIMAGSGKLSSALASLYNSSSPVNYSVPSGFTPPMTPSQTASAPYTYKNSSGTLIDNSASRLNVAKAGLLSVLNQYLPSMDFALEDYSTSGLTKYTTWVYYMAPPNGFSVKNALPVNGFTSYKAYQSFVSDPNNANANPAATRWVNNPCFNYTNATSSVYNNCSAIDSASQMGSGVLANSQYLQIGASSDDPNVNDVLYASGLDAIGLAYGGPSPSNPFSAYTLTQYNASLNNIKSTYKYGVNSVAKTTTPTNAGYIPYQPQVLYVQRGFGYGATPISNTGNNIVGMTELGTNPSVSAVNTALTPFQKALAPETNSTSSTEIKASAGQATTPGLINGAGGVLSNLPPSCAGQYVILVTDGLPTMDSSGSNWPPLGSAAGQGFKVNAAFYGVAGNANYGINDDSGNVPSGESTGGLDTSNTNDQALIDTISAIKTLNQKGIKTYVIGLGAGVDSTANPAAYYALNAMAIAGGTGVEYPASNIPAFNAALNSIAAQIFSNIQVSAPVAPTSITGGSLIYTATSNNNPGAIAGHIQAYATAPLPSSTASAPVGTASGPAVWDAGQPSKMPIASRQANLYSTTGTASGAGPGSGTIDTLQNIGGNSGSPNYSPSAFALSATTCVPDVSTILAYTFDPSFNSAGDSANLSGLGFPGGVGGCSYLAGRQLNWMLGGLSPNDHVQYLGSPGNATLLGMGGYVAFANNNKSREKLLTFTSNDGFLYAVDALTGKLVWGWMPRSFLPQLQYYTSFQTQQNFDGNYTTTDAVNTTTSPSAGNWATYVVGTAQGGAYHYALKLSSNTASSATTPPVPVAQTWGITVPGGSSPQMQAPIVVTLNGMQYAVFVVNTTTGTGTSAVTTSTLYEVNVATGQAAIGAALPLGRGVSVTSSLTYVSVTGTLWFGDSQGGIWEVNLSGAASADATSAVNTGSTSPGAQINYVGYTEIGGLPYVWAATQSEITAFGLSGATSQIIWASSGTSGYQPNANGTLQSVASNVVMPLQTGGQISAAPVLVNGVLVVPVYVPPSASSCGAGTGYYDLFDLVSGGLPKIPITYRNNAVTNGVIALGSGIPLSPAVYVTPSGTVIYPGSSTPPNSTTSNIAPINFGGNVMNKPIAWRQY